MFADDRNAEASRYVALRPRRRFAVIEGGVRHELRPERDRVSVGHVWAVERPELWEPVGRVAGQSRDHYDRAAERTRAELASLCGRAAAQLERPGNTRARAAVGATRTQRPLRLP